MVMERPTQRLGTGQFQKAYPCGGRAIDPPSVFGSDDEWEAFYQEMREYASTDADAARWVERAKRVLQGRRARRVMPDRGAA
jgi:hypothetical protein